MIVTRATALHFPYTVGPRPWQRIQERSERFDFDQRTLPGLWIERSRCSDAFANMLRLGTLIGERLTDAICNWRADPFADLFQKYYPLADWIQLASENK